MRSLDLTIFSDITKTKLLNRLESQPPQQKPENRTPKHTTPNTGGDQGWSKGWGEGTRPSAMGSGGGRGETFTAASGKSTEGADGDTNWHGKLSDVRAKAAVEQVSRATRTKNDNARANSAKRQLDLDERQQALAMERARFRQSQIWGWLRLLGCLLLGLVVAALAALLLYRAYRWCVEAPLIKEVVKQVEVEKPVERIVEKPVEKQVKVIPKECTQIRRNGEIYINCDGVTVKGGAHTVQESGIDKVPELLPDSK